MRELRVLSRRRSTWTERALLTAVILLTWACFRNLWGFGHREILVSTSFAALLIFGFGAAVASSDAISSERRNHTLGLLLLTPLRYWEVLLGKLAACISRYFFCLVAILPVLALPFLGGGVEGAAVIRHFLGLLAISLLGMSIGLASSVLCRRASAAASLSLALMLFLFLAPLIGAGLIHILGIRHLFGFVWAGPLYLPLHDTRLHAVYGTWPLNLSVILGLGLGFLLLASALFSLVWRRERRAEGGKAEGKSRTRRFVPIRDGVNPFLLFRRPAGFAYLAGNGLVLMLSTTPLLADFSSDTFQNHLGLSYLTGLIPIAAAYWICSLEAILPTSRLQRTGMIELIRTAPLSRRTLRSGLALPARAALLRNGFLILCWNLALLLALLAIAPTVDLHGVIAFTLIPMHVAALVVLPIELTSLRAAGLWLGLRAARPLAASAILFLFHAVPPALPMILFIAGYTNTGFLQTMNFAQPVVYPLAFYTLILFRVLLPIAILAWSRRSVRRLLASGAAG